MATGPIETHLHRSFNWENGAPGPREGPRERSANCGNGLFAQCVRLRSEINLSVSHTVPYVCDISSLTSKIVLSKMFKKGLYKPRANEVKNSLAVD